MSNEVVNPLTEDTPNVHINEAINPEPIATGGSGGNVYGDTGSSVRGYIVYNGTKYYSPTYNFTTDYVVEKGNFTLTSYSYEDEVTPPVPLPPIVPYKGDNILSSSETVGNVELTGLIKATE